MRRLFWVVLLIGLALAFVLSVSLGSVRIPIESVLRVLFGGEVERETWRTIIWQFRLPKAITAMLAGAALSIAGMQMQTLFRNPLADPFVMGVSGGAAAGALCGMLLGVGLYGLQWFATAGALLTGVTVLLLGSRGGLLKLLLTGVVIASACGALISVILTIADSTQLRGMVFWLAGDLGWAQRPEWDLLLAGLCLAAALLFGRSLNVLAAGELRSATLGLANGPARLAVFSIAALLTASAVLSAGTVGFVGLVAPHLVRLALRTSDHRVVAPAAALCGGTMLCLADLLSRTVVAPRQLPVGAVMALIGTPVFLWLLRRQSAA
jgi:iron complex transport system permease protein